MQIKTVEQKVIFKFDEVSNKILEEVCYFEKKKKKRKTLLPIFLSSRCKKL